MTINIRINSCQFTTLSDQSALEMTVNFAEVLFIKDKILSVVPVEWVKVSKIKNDFFDPVNYSDFDGQKIYYVKWYFCGKNGQCCESNHKHKYEYYSAYICSLSDTKKIIKKTNTDSDKRKKFPNKRFLVNETSTDADHESSKSESSQEESHSSLPVKKKIDIKRKASQETLLQHSGKMAKVTKNQQFRNSNSFIPEDNADNVTTHETHSTAVDCINAPNESITCTENSSGCRSSILMDSTNVLRNEAISKNNSFKTYSTSAVSIDVPRKQSARKSFKNVPSNVSSTIIEQNRGQEFEKMLSTSDTFLDYYNKNPSSLKKNETPSKLVGKVTTWISTYISRSITAEQDRQASKTNVVDETREDH